MLRQNDTDTENPKVVTEEELRLVLDQLAHREVEASGRTSVSTDDVAETLGVPEEKVAAALSEIRAKQAERAQLARRRLLAMAIGIPLALVTVLNFPFAPSKPNLTSSVVETTQDVLPGGGRITTVEIELRYQPPTLWRLMKGADWGATSEGPQFWDSKGPHSVFMRKDGSGVGITNGWLSRTGLTTYRFKYQFPEHLADGPVTQIVGKFKADGRVVEIISPTR